MAQGSRLKAQGKVRCLQPRASSLERRGFTFVELLIAATMMSVLFVGLGSHLRGGLLVWRQTTQTVDALQREGVALDRLERDLANAINYADSRTELPLPAPSFASDELRWFTVQQRHQERDAIRLVTYRCESAEHLKGLWRTSQSVGEARAALEPVKELVLPGCETLHVRYAYAPAEGTGSVEWRDEWRYPEEMPQLVEVTLELTGGRATRRLMAIPQGSFKPAEESS